MSRRGGRQARALIAQQAAQLIAEHGIQDWGLAKRKAARQLGLSEREHLPDNADVEEALRDYHALYEPEEQMQWLREMRLEALDWLERLAAFEPELVGAVADGWATAHSEIRLELTADDAKTLEIFLLAREIPFEALPQREGAARAVPHYRLEGRSAPVRLVVRDPAGRRNLSREGKRLKARQLADLLAADAA